MDGNQIILARWGDSGAWADQREYTFLAVVGGALRFAVTDTLHQEDTSFHNFDTPAGVLPLASWSHVAATFDGSTGTRVIYLNGVERARRQDGPMSLFAAAADVGIGAYLSAPGLPLAFFHGEIDEISLYNRALTAAEIQSVYVAGSAGKCKN